MGLLEKLLHRPEAPESPQESDASTMEDTACPHLALVPRWDSVADMGHEDRVTGYHCEGCNTDFTAEEGWALRANEGNRIREGVPPDSLN